jgi:hypothetical protein
MMPRANHIDHVIGDCRLFDAAQIDTVFRTHDLCVSESPQE